MKYFFPDSQDLVDPSFDFKKEERSINRVRQRDDQYAHEIFAEQPFDGLLVSKGIVDGFGASSGRYTAGQRHRLLRLGAPEFFRVADRRSPLPLMGDCGAFTYVREAEPPYSVNDLLDFYENCRFNYGLSLDHVILQYEPTWDKSAKKMSTEQKQASDRRKLTLELAAEFLKEHKANRCSFEPIGVAQGWSPKSYADSVKKLLKMGYRYLALGGMVPLKTEQILACLEAIRPELSAKVQMHLLGITRVDHINTFAAHGVTSFDSTSPLRQAFKDDRDNYYTPHSTYVALRIPQVQGNPSLQKAIQAGAIKQEEARRLEQKALGTMEDFENRRASVAAALEALLAYEHLYDPKANHEKEYRRTLEDAPWRKCRCEVCRELRHHVILFRGAERNRRRGFHNVWTFYRRVRGAFGHEAAA